MAQRRKIAAKMKSLSWVVNLLLAVVLVIPFIATVFIFAPVDADEGGLPAFTPKYPSENRTLSYSTISQSVLTGNARNFNASIKNHRTLWTSECTAGPVAQSLGAGFLEDVYVNGATGNDIYDGSSPSVQVGGIGPKKTIQAGIDACEYDGTVHIAAGLYRENIVIDMSIYLEGAGARSTVIDGGNAGVVVDITGTDEYIDIYWVTIRNGTGEWAGGITNGDGCSLALWQCAIVGNSGEVAGGIDVEDGRLIVEQCLVAGNIGGMFGGGIFSYYSQTEIVASTISGNSLMPGGQFGGGICNWMSETYLFDSTVTNNSAINGSYGAGGGIGGITSVLLYANTIVAGNRASLAGTGNAYYLDLFFMDDYYCIDSENSCHFTDTMSQINTDPKLGPLQDNGGPTDTHAISVDSPAFDRGARTIGYTWDQRDVTRPQGLAYDVGAFEVEVFSGGNVQARGGTGPEVINFTCNAGGIFSLTALPPSSCSAALPAGMILPYGLFSYRIASIVPGSTVMVTIKFPRTIPSTFQYFKCSGTGVLLNVTNLVTHNPGDDFIVLSLTDGGPGDLDGLVNGKITDPGGPAWNPNGLQPQSHSSYIAPPQQPVRLSSVSVQGATISASTVRPGEPVAVTATLVNKSDLNGAMKLSLYINGEEEAVQGVTVNSGNTMPVTFTVSRNEPGTYSVYAGGAYAGDFTVSGAIDSSMIILIISMILCLGSIAGLVILFRRQRQGY